MPEEDRYYYISRDLCTVLEEMRKCFETRNFAYMPGLIEEAQSMANRMEARLREIKDLKKMNEEWHRLKAEIKALREEKKAEEAKKEDPRIPVGRGT